MANSIVPVDNCHDMGGSSPIYTKRIAGFPRVQSAPNQVAGLKDASASPLRSMWMLVAFDLSRLEIHLGGVIPIVDAKRCQM